MARADMEERIRAIISSVAGTGMVHDYQRATDQWKDFLDLFKDPDSNRIAGWCFSRITVARRQTRHGEIDVAHVWRVRGYASLLDAEASEKDFQAVIDDVINAFDDDDTLDGTCETTHPDFGPLAGAAGLQADVIDHRMFGRVLCHFFEGRLCAVAAKAI